MDAGIECSKEMVDLLMRIKRHAKAHHGVSISMSDDELMGKMLAMATIKDDLLQGMLHYFMVLAGGNWADRYARAAGAKSGSVQDFARKVKDSILKDVGGVAAAQTAGPAEASGTKVRYYRGQPVYS